MRDQCLFNFEWILQRTESLKAADTVFEFIGAGVPAEYRFWTRQRHFLHVLMLRSDGKTIHVHRNRHHDFICTRATVAAGTATHTVRRQAGFDPFPFGPTILEPDFYL